MAASLSFVSVSFFSFAMATSIAKRVDEEPRASRSAPPLVCLGKGSPLGLATV